MTDKTQQGPRWPKGKISSGPYNHKLLYGKYGICMQKSLCALLEKTGFSKIVFVFTNPSLNMCYVISSG